MNEENQQQTKKSYEKPELRSYGDIREVTRVVGRSGSNDSGVGQGKDMTHA